MQSFIPLSFLFFLLPLSSLRAQSGTPSPKHFWHSLKTQASPEAIWSVWTKVSTWHEWDTGLRMAEMTEPFELGSKGVITSLEWRRSRFQVVALEPGRSYTFKTRLPLGGLYVKRSLKATEEVTTFTHEVWFQGLTGGLFAKQFGPDFMEKLPSVMENVKRLAEQHP